MYPIMKKAIYILILLIFIAGVYVFHEKSSRAFSSEVKALSLKLKEESVLLVHHIAKFPFSLHYEVPVYPVENPLGYKGIAFAKTKLDIELYPTKGGFTEYKMSINEKFFKGEKVVRSSGGKSIEKYKGTTLRTNSNYWSGCIGNVGTAFYYDKEDNTNNLCVLIHYGNDMPDYIYYGGKERPADIPSLIIPAEYMPSKESIKGLAESGLFNGKILILSWDRELQ